MCGIAGFARRGGADAGGLDESSLRSMCGAITHRGPDDDGFYVNDQIALGMRRLSIIDVAGGHQPISNEDETVHVVFNGEVYNYPLLRDRLRRNGHTLRTTSDTETLVHLYEDLGDRCVHELRGMFGFAIWDARRSRLLVGRDRLGIKPLYYWPLTDGVAFASELRSFLALDEFPRELDRDALAQYFALGYVPDPDTIFRSARKLPPGHLLTWSAADGLSVQRYWSPVRGERPVADPREAIEELRRLLRECVRSHLMSEVPLGAFLSGGIDSSAVVAAMQEAMDTPVRTFSIGFDETSFDESKHAARIASAIGTAHTEFIVRPEVDALVEDVVRAFDEPFADSSAIPTYLVSQLARRHVTVALSGDGGDELFGGYTRYRQALDRRSLPPGLMRDTVRWFADALPHGAPARNYLRDLARTARGRYAGTVALPVRVTEGGVAHANVSARAPSPDALLDRWFDAAPDRDFATQMMLVDLQSYLPGDILTKVDRASMASSLEARVPFLDHELVEFAVSLPSAVKMRDGQGKWILRRAIEGLVPPAVLSHPKRGFGVPLVHWLRRELAHRVDAILDPARPIGAYIDPRAVRRIVREHRMRRRDHSHLLWRLVVLDLWLGCLTRGELARTAASDAVREFVTVARS